MEGGVEPDGDGEAVLAQDEGNDGVTLVEGQEQTEKENSAEETFVTKKTEETTEEPSETITEEE